MKTVAFRSHCLNPACFVWKEAKFYCSGFHFPYLGTFPESLPGRRSPSRSQSALWGSGFGDSGDEATPPLPRASAGRPGCALLFEPGRNRILRAGGVSLMSQERGWFPFGPPIIYTLPKRFGARRGAAPARWIVRSSRDSLFSFFGAGGRGAGRRSGWGKKKSSFFKKTKRGSIALRSVGEEEEEGSP